jgi:organic hydroperoxide reductase OsmC/OhrA
MSTIPVARPAPNLAPPVREPHKGFSLSIGLLDQYQQIVDFRLPGVAVLGLDECPPLGRGWGPAPAHLLASALAACLGGTLLKSLRDAGTEVLDLRTHVTGTLGRNVRGQSYIASVVVRLTPVLARETRAMPTPEQLAERSMIADAMRRDLEVRVAITPEIRHERGADGFGDRDTDGRASFLATGADLVPK